MGLEKLFQKLGIIGGLAGLCISGNARAEIPENVYVIEESKDYEAFNVKSDKEINMRVWDGDNVYIGFFNNKGGNISLYNLSDRTEGDGWESLPALPPGNYTITFSQQKDFSPGQTPEFPETLIITNGWEMKVNEFGFEADCEICSASNNSVTFSSNSSNPHFWILKSGGSRIISPISCDSYDSYPVDGKFTIRDNYQDINVTLSSTNEGYDTKRLRDGVYPVAINSLDGYESIRAEEDGEDAKIYLTKPVPPIPQDVNQDGKVNILDLIYVRNKLNQNPGSGDNWRADVNDDGRINILDLISIRNKLDIN